MVYNIDLECREAEEARRENYGRVFTGKSRLDRRQQMAENELAVREPQLALGQLMFDDPAAMIAQAKVVATMLKEVITSQGLYVTISKKNYVLVEGWTTLGAMLGVAPRTVSVEEIKEGVFEAVVELVQSANGTIIGRGIAECGADEPWASRDRYARKSMAITRATGKAYRLSYSWIIKLAGYEGTPAEEMPGRKSKKLDEAPE